MCFERVKFSFCGLQKVVFLVLFFSSTKRQVFSFLVSFPLPLFLAFLECIQFLICLGVPLYRQDFNIIHLLWCLGMENIYIYTHTHTSVMRWFSQKQLGLANWKLDVVENGSCFVWFGNVIGSLDCAFVNGSCWKWVLFKLFIITWACWYYSPRFKCLCKLWSFYCEFWIWSVDG